MPFHKWSNERCSCNNNNNKKTWFRSISVGNLGKKMKEVGGGPGGAPAWRGFFVCFSGSFSRDFSSPLNDG